MSGYPTTQFPIPDRAAALLTPDPAPLETYLLGLSPPYMYVDSTNGHDSGNVTEGLIQTRGALPRPYPSSFPHRKNAGRSMNRLVLFQMRSETFTHMTIPSFRYGVQASIRCASHRASRWLATLREFSRYKDHRICISPSSGLPPLVTKLAGTNGSFLPITAGICT